MAETSNTLLYRFSVYPRRDMDPATSGVRNWSLVFKRDTFPVKDVPLCSDRVLSLEGKTDMYSMGDSEFLKQTLGDRYDEYFRCFLTVTETEIKLVGKTENVLRNGMNAFLREVLPETEIS